MIMMSTVRRSSVVALCASVGLVLGSLGGSASAVEATVGLGTAGSYVVLAGTTVTNTGPSTVQGSLGVSPGSEVTGFPPGVVSNGSIHAADAEALNAQAAVTTAFNDAAGRSSTGAISADLAGMTLIPGVYTGGELALSGTLTLDGKGDPNAVFVFQAASTLVTGSSSKVSLTGGAAACNVFWQVGSSATIGTSSSFVGTVLALTSIAAKTDASIQGRLLARNGAVTLESNTFSLPSCRSVGTTTQPGGGTDIPSTGGRVGVTFAAAMVAVLVGGSMVIGVRRSTRVPKS